MDDRADETILGAERQYAGNETTLNGKANPERSAFDDKYRIFHMLREAQSTIINQREQIARLTPKAEAYDRMGQILDLSNRGRDGWGIAAVDPAWEIDAMTERMQREFEAEKREAYERELGPDAAETERPIDRMARGTASADLSGAGVRVASEPEPGT